MRKRVKKEKEDPIVSLRIGWGRWRAERGVLDVFLHLHAPYILSWAKWLLDVPCSSLHIL